jgi:hypothetical protein
VSAAPDASDAMETMVARWQTGVCASWMRPRVQRQLFFLCGAPHKTKNWLFIGHPEAGWRSAVIYSLLITARRAGLDPAKWLEDVLRRIPTATTANLHELLPANWRPATA